MKFKTLHLKLCILAASLLVLNGCEKPVLPEGGFMTKAVLSEESFQVGDVITLTMTAHHAPGSIVQFPDLGSRKEIIVRGRATETSVPAEGVLETEEIIRLTSLRPGNWLITTNEVVCTFSDGAQKSQALPPLMLKVESSLTAENAGKLSDIKGPFRHPLRLPRVLWVSILIILIALLAGFIALRFIKNPQALLAPEPVIPPHIRARNALAALRNKEWVPEPFFVDLSLILRTYLEDRFYLNAPELTTEELAGKLQADPQLNTENRQTLQQFFTQADLVKFARAGAEQDVMRTAFTMVEQFIEQTEHKEVMPQASTQNSK